MRNLDPKDKATWVGKELSPRERQVCELAATGLTNKQVAERLGIGFGTVRCHLFVAYAKRGWRNRVDMTRAMMELETA